VRRPGAFSLLPHEDPLPHFLLYSRSYCHLCQDMLDALQQYALESDFSVEVIDVDADADLVAQFDELVPVLFGVRAALPPQRLCHYFLDHAAVRGFLAA
jgi:thiol-disulfide isomerase/thioredoxin